MEENAKVKGTRKVRAAGKKKKGRRLRRLCPPQFPLFIFWCSHFLNSADPVSGPDLEAWNTVVKASPATPCWQLSTQNLMRTLPLWMLLQCPSIWRTRGRCWVLPCHVCTIPWMAVESEIPSFATGCALIVSKGTGPGNTKSSVRKVFIKDAVLHPQWKSRKQQIRKWGNDSDRSSVILVILLLLSYYKSLIKWVIRVVRL